MTNDLTTALNVLLADYQVFYQRLRNYHWTVRGPHFFHLHHKFEELYLDAAQKVDDLAERILALAASPLPTLQAQLAQARLTEDEGSPDADAMVSRVAEDIVHLNARLRDAAGVAEDQEDRASANLLEGMADEQEKTLWMLRASLS